MSAQTPSPTILIVEDHQQVRSSLKSWMTSALPDFKLLSTDSGEGAVMLAKDHALGLVLMDIGLPGMNGIEATRQIRALQPEAKIVMLSIHDEPSYRKDAQNAGATAFISKSRMMAELLPMLKKLIRVGEEI